MAAAPLWNGRQLAGNWDVIWYYTLQHARYTVLAVALGFLFALPAAYLAVRHRGIYPVLLTITNVIYAIPALTLFVLLSPWLGYLNDKPIVIAMALYTLVILVRNIVEGIRAVPDSVLRAADGLGYRPFRRFAAVELPLALPGIVAGLRLATVSTVSLISVGALIGRGAPRADVRRRLPAPDHRRAVGGDDRHDVLGAAVRPRHLHDRPGLDPVDAGAEAGRERRRGGPP